MKRILVLTALLLTSGAAGAAFYDTAYLKRLVDDCNSLPDTFEANPESFVKVKDCGLSTGYILGVFDALNVMADRSTCVPATVRSEQVVTAVERWLRAHPGHEQDPAHKTVKSAVDETWACGK